MLILFIRKRYNHSQDGGDIYNIKLIEGLRSCGIQVKEYEIDQNKKGYIPLWKWRLEQRDITSIKALQGNFVTTIISHEALSDLVKHVRCDLFICHNLMSRIKHSSLIPKLYYQIGANRLEKKTIHYSKHFLVLSYREYSHIKDLDKTHYLPPGINEMIKTVDNNNQIYLNSSSGWYLKKHSNLNKTETENISKYYEIKVGNKFSKIGIIEDLFDCGFKLRLIQMLFNCDLIITKLDFSKEIKALGCSAKNVFQFSDFSKIDLRNLYNSVDHNVNKKNREHLTDKFNWSSIAANIIDVLQND